MPHLLFYEAAAAPTTRSVRELSSLRERGWDITVAHDPSLTDAVLALGLRSQPLPPRPGNLLRERLNTEYAGVTADLDRVRAEIATLTKGNPATQLRARLVELRDQVEALVATIAERRTAQDKAGEAAARARLDAVKQERTAVADRIHALDASLRGDVDGLKRRRDSLAARSRTLKAIRRQRTPMTLGAMFGDLVRLEAAWQADAPVLAAVDADVLWAADLDALPPVVWAAEASPKRPPVVYDAHELFAELEYLPELFQVAWHRLATEFIPRADAVITVCEPIAAILDNEYGANGTIVIPNYAMPSTDSPTGATLRTTLGLDPSTPLAVHIGNIAQTRNPQLAVHLLAELPDLHVAFVGAGQTSALDDLRELARATGVADRLHYVPPVPLTELVSFVSDADVSLIMLNSSRSRDTRYTFPNKLFDSLAAGVPVVANEDGLAGEFVAKEQLGATYVPEQPGQLAAAVSSVLADPSIGERVRTRTREFTWANAEPTLFALLDRVMAEPKGQ